MKTVLFFSIVLTLFIAEPIYGSAIDNNIKENNFFTRDSREVQNREDILRNRLEMINEKVTNLVQTVTSDTVDGPIKQGLRSIEKQLNKLKTRLDDENKLSKINLGILDLEPLYEMCKRMKDMIERSTNRIADNEYRMKWQKVLAEAIVAIEKKDFSKAEDQLVLIGNQFHDDDVIEIFVKKAYNDVDPNIESILEFSDNLKNTTKGLLINFALYKQLQNKIALPHLVNTLNSIENKIMFGSNFAYYVPHEAEKIVQIMKIDILNKLKKEISREIIQNTEPSQHILDIIDSITSHDHQLFEMIFLEAIDDVHTGESENKIAKYLGMLNKPEQIMTGFLAMMKSIEKKFNIYNDDLFQLAYRVKEFMDKDKNKNLITRKILQRIQDKLPKSLKNIVFADWVCIKNTYHNEYLYSNIQREDGNRRWVHTWLPSYNNKQDRQSHWKIIRDKDDGSFKIYNKFMKEYLYASEMEFGKNSRLVFTWIPNNDEKTEERKWTIQLRSHDNIEIINKKSKSHLYAPMNAVNKNDRNVLTWNPGNGVVNGMWMIEDCS